MHVTMHIHAQEHIPTNTNTQRPGKTMPPHMCVHADFGKIKTMTHTEAHAPHKILTHTPMGLAPVCLRWYTFLCMYVHGHVHIRSTPAASFSRVLSVYAIAITYSHGCTTTCTHAEPCAHVRGGARACRHMNAAQIPVTLPSSTVILPPAGCWHAGDVQDLAPTWASPVLCK